MAEAAAVATVVGIASFGIQLTKILYDFGSTVSSAREEASYIARHVDLYANVLDILTERIDDEEPILTDAALDLIEELNYQSNEIFTKIEALLPQSRLGKDDISFLEKIKWNFRKPKVEFLVGELSCLRSTVHLLVTIIFTGRKLQKRKGKSKVKNENEASLEADLQRQGVKARNALVEQVAAQDHLIDLQKEAEKEQNFTQNLENRPIAENHANHQTQLICGNETTLDVLQQTLTACEDRTERQRQVIQQSGHILRQLLQQWTVVGLEGQAGSPETDVTEENPIHTANGLLDPSQGAQSAEETTSNVTGGVPSSSRSKAPVQQDVLVKDTDTAPVEHIAVHELRDSLPFPSGTTSTQAAGEKRSFSSSGEIRTNTIRNNSPYEPQHPHSQASASPSLPRGWVAHWSSDARCFYFHELSTGKTQWDKPELAKEARSSKYLESEDFERIRTPYASASGEKTRVGGLYNPQDKYGDERSVETNRGGFRPGTRFPPKASHQNDEKPSRSQCGICSRVDSKRSDRWTTCYPCRGTGSFSHSRQDAIHFPCYLCNGLGHIKVLPKHLFGGNIDKHSLKTMKSSFSCPRCDGLVGYPEISRKCTGCGGVGVKEELVQNGPMLERWRVLCTDCNGQGQTMAHGSDPSTSTSRAADHEREAKRDASNGMSSRRYRPNHSDDEDAIPAEKVQCASQ